MRRCVQAAAYSAVLVLLLNPVCCLQLMVQPVTLPSGKTFEYEAIRKWITQHGTDPTTGLTPVSIHDVHPNLIVREMVEKWLAGVDPLADHADSSAAA